MANENQLKLIKESVEVWNDWKTAHEGLIVDLSGADLHDADLRKADLRKSDLRGADLSSANLFGVELGLASLRSASLYEADLREANLLCADLSNVELGGANLSKARLYDTNLWFADLEWANLSGAELIGADLTGANLRSADLSGADLTDANLDGAILIETHLERTILSNCNIYGISAWKVTGTPKDQSSLVITPKGEPEITVDDLRVAQFIYLILDNKNVRNVIDTLTSKAVLILGRFTDERKAMLDTLHNELRKRNYLPILVDFSGPQNRDITETVSTLAHMARFVIADITDARSISQELQAIVPNLPSVPVQPMLLVSQTEYGMFEHFKRYPWVLDTYYYDAIGEVIGVILEKIIKRLEDKVLELRG
jgi:uncharacterized protein YjbI with pentapeptide repeats